MASKVVSCLEPTSSGKLTGVSAAALSALALLSL